MKQEEIAVLVLRARVGDRPAYGALVEGFRNAVYGIAFERLRDHAEAEDLAQDVFIHAMRKIVQVRQPAAFPGWLRQLTIRQAINRLTRRRRHDSLQGPGAVEPVAPGPGPAELAERADCAAAVRRCLGRLGVLDRETLLAFYMRDRSLTQMGAEFGVPLGTVKRRLHTARARLRERLLLAGFPD